MIFHVICLFFLGSSMAQAAESTDRGWKQISDWPVCVKPRDDGYGHLQYSNNQESKLVGALKLKHLSGRIRCTNNEAFNSKWGCGARKNLLNIIITDESNHVIFPLPQFIKEIHGMWYYMPLVHDEYSDELVFADFCHPFFLPNGGILRFWYGEDLNNNSENDNQGQVCFHVFARFV